MADEFDDVEDMLEAPYRKDVVEVRTKGWKLVAHLCGD